MPIIKCDYCGSKKEIDNYLKYYSYKTRLRTNGREVYFCSYEHLRKAIKENPKKYQGKKYEIDLTR